MHPTIGIIGAGKVGATLARLWYQAGYKVRAVYSPNLSHAQHLAEKVSARVVASPVAVIAEAELTLLTVPDDMIALLAEQIAEQMQPVQGKAVVHTSGSQDRGALSALAQVGLMTGSLHPAFPFADVETSIKTLPSAAFAMEAVDDVLRGWLGDLVGALNGALIDVPEGKKAQYHAALVIASNYTVTLYAIAEQLLQGMGASAESAGAALNPLMDATVKNLREQGIPAALTGPLTRADIGTLETHVNALKDIDSHLVDVYIQLARLSYPMLEARGVDVEFIEKLLKTQD